MEICDKIGNSSAAAKESLRIIVKRLNNPDPHVVVKALTVSSSSDEVALDNEQSSFVLFTTENSIDDSMIHRI